MSAGERELEISKLNGKLMQLRMDKLNADLEIKKLKSLAHKSSHSQSSHTQISDARISIHPSTISFDTQVSDTQVSDTQVSSTQACVHDPTSTYTTQLKSSINEFKIKVNSYQSKNINSLMLLDRVEERMSDTLMHLTETDLFDRLEVDVRRFLLAKEYHEAVNRITSLSTTPTQTQASGSNLNLLQVLRNEIIQVISKDFIVSMQPTLIHLFRLLNDQSYRSLLYTHIPFPRFSFDWTTCTGDINTLAEYKIRFIDYTSILLDSLFNLYPLFTRLFGSKVIKSVVGTFNSNLILDSNPTDNPDTSKDNSVNGDVEMEFNLFIAHTLKSLNLEKVVERPDEDNLQTIVDIYVDYKRLLAALHSEFKYTGELGITIFDQVKSDFMELDTNVLNTALNVFSTQKRVRTFYLESIRLIEGSIRRYIDFNIFTYIHLNSFIHSLLDSILSRLGLPALIDVTSQTDFTVDTTVIKTVTTVLNVTSINTVLDVTDAIGDTTAADCNSIDTQFEGIEDCVEDFKGCINFCVSLLKFTTLDHRDADTCIKSGTLTPQARKIKVDMLQIRKIVGSAQQKLIESILLPILERITRIPLLQLYSLNDPHHKSVDPDRGLLVSRYVTEIGEFVLGLVGEFDSLCTGFWFWYMVEELEIDVLGSFTDRELVGEAGEHGDFQYDYEKESDEGYTCDDYKLIVEGDEKEKEDTVLKWIKASLNHTEHQFLSSILLVPHLSIQGCKQMIVDVGYLRNVMLDLEFEGRGFEVLLRYLKTWPPNFEGFDDFRESDMNTEIIET